MKKKKQKINFDSYTVKSFRNVNFLLVTFRKIFKRNINFIVPDECSFWQHLLIFFTFHFHPSFPAIFYAGKIFDFLLKNKTIYNKLL